MESDRSVPVRIKVFLALFGLMVSALVLELAFRLIAPGLKAPTWTDRPYGFFLPDTAPSLQDSAPQPKAPGSFRIAAIGDSFTFGPHLQLNDTYPKKMEYALNLNTGAPRVEVLNRGVCGSSTVVEVELLRRALAEKPDVVLLNITLNDAEPHILSKREREEMFHSSFLSWGIWRWWRSAGFVAARFHNTKTVRAYINYHTTFFKNPQTLDRFTASLDAMKRLTDEKKIPLVAALFPLFDFPIDERYPFAEVHQIIEGALKSRSIPFIDLKDSYTNIPPARLQVIPGVDNHPNEIAHRIAAEAIVAKLVTEKLIPEKSIPTGLYKKRIDARGAPSRDPQKSFKRALEPEHRETRAKKAKSAASGPGLSKKAH